MKTILEVDSLSKCYRPQVLGMGSLRDSFKYWWDRSLAQTKGAQPSSPATDASAFWALKDVSFSVLPGEALGVLGKNGAGKSTLLRILARLTEPTRGQARVRGRVASLLEVGSGFHPDLTGRENVYLNGAFLGMQRNEISSSFKAIVAFAELEKFIDVPIKQYSKGMYTRLAFSIAAHLTADILLMDEILEMGDVFFQQRALEKMRAKCREGKTLIFVSHHEKHLRSLCQRALLLEGGQLTFDGSLEAGLKQYSGQLTPNPI